MTAVNGMSTARNERKPRTGRQAGSAEARQSSVAGVRTGKWAFRWTRNDVGMYQMAPRNYMPVTTRRWQKGLGLHNIDHGNPSGRPLFVLNIWASTAACGVPGKLRCEMLLWWWVLEVCTAVVGARWAGAVQQEIMEIIVCRSGFLL